MLVNAIATEPELVSDSEITNLDVLTIGSNLQNLKNIENNLTYKFIKDDIKNESTIDGIVKDMDVVVNFAAESHVDRSISDANPFLVSNIRGAFTILDIITKQKKRMIQISTDEVFGSLMEGTANEYTKFNPSSPYAATKAAAELLINSYSTTFNSDVVITRCTNNFGPRQFVEKLIPKTIFLANKDLKIPIYGTGKNIRDWIFVDNHCEAIETVLFKGKTGESYNISADNEIDNLTIVKKILEMMNKSENLIDFVEDRPGHDFRYSMTSQKISNELNWKINTNFEKGLEKTIQWYLENSEQFDNILQTILDPTPWKEK